ncbi:heterokaryon incompatibility protein-domain-containing protein [Xylogone sp. PMI_703]|nr:heterokaryon incompatibility protein-domain-containing protein [Xylogone sp. PMI_703]
MKFLVKQNPDLYFSLHPNEIRLVNIIEGCWGDEICAQLRHSSLANKPGYKALSYVSIWVDALCINQVDNTERTHQAKLMRDIYASTEAVIVYLGEVPHGFVGGPIESKDCGSASVFYGDERDGEKLECFQSRFALENNRKILTKRVRLNYGHDVFCYISLLAQSLRFENSFLLNEASRNYLHSSYLQNVFEAIRRLMNAAWWNRIWVIREAVVSKNIILYYGSNVAPWDMFVKGGTFYFQNMYSPAMSFLPPEYTSVVSFFSQNVLDVHRMRGRWEQGQNTSLLSLLRQFSDRRATDDRDKVYALLGLVRDSSLLPDYSKDTPTVFLDAVLDIIETTGSLDVLIGDLGRKNCQDLPSWVIDWTATFDDLDPRRAENIDYYNATLSSVIYIERRGDYSGIVQYLNRLRLAYNKGKESDVQELSDPEDFSKVLGSSVWKDYLSNSKKPVDDADCLESITNYFAVRSGPLFPSWLQDHGGILKLPGLHVDTVTAIGVVSFLNEELSSVVRS